MKKEVLDRIEKTIRFMPRIEVIRLSKNDYDDLVKFSAKEHRKIYGIMDVEKNDKGEFIYKGVTIKHV